MVSVPLRGNGLKANRIEKVKTLVYCSVSVPLRGNGLKAYTLEELCQAAAVKFPSPCGVMD